MGKSCLANLMASCDEVVVLVDKRRATDVVYRGFCKAFDMAQTKSLVLNYRYMSLMERLLDG